MTDLPARWLDVDLGNVATFVMGQAPPGQDCNKNGEGAPFVKAGEFGLTHPVIREWTTRPLKIARSTDVLICVVGATCGKINLGADCAIGRSVAAIRPNHGLRQDYLFQFLQTQISSLRAGSTGSAQGVISQDALSKVRLPLAPRAEQDRIVAKIDSLVAKSKRARVHLDHVSKLVKRYKQAFLDAAFRGDLTAEWRAARGGLNPEMVEIREIAEVVTGATPPSASKAEYFGGTIAFFKPTDLDAGYHVTSPRETLTEMGAHRLRLVPSGSTLVTCIGATIGKTGFARVECCTNQQINALIPDPNRVLPEWLYWGTVSPTFQNNIIQNASATTLPIINKGRFQRLSFSLPTLEEQVELVRLIEAAFAWIDRLTSEATSARKLIDHLDQAILSKAFRGELVPQDRDDEPASVLLERIKAEQIGVTAARRGRGRPRLATAI
jgi:type I restriction enzyme S subunit